MASDSETLKQDMAELRASLDRLSKDVASISQSLAQELKSRATGKADDLRDRARAVADDVSAKGKESAEALEKTVRERPLQSLLIAFGAGLLLAHLLRKH
jgi:ElaB/YqjD/DUF883 family membrane-anchored ribosome-binding protein